MSRDYRSHAQHETCVSISSGLRITEVYQALSVFPWSIIKAMKRFVRTSLIVVLLITTISLVRSIWVSSGSLDDLKTNEEEIERLRGENERLRQEKEFRQTDFYVEKAARDTLGLARSGETVLIEDNEASVSAQKEGSTLANWQSWFNLFSN